ncbi:ABC transporter permease [Cohaesibacter celericrescens]|uniref:ABC transporter permease n=1 Tax=Cohaesibacter celericrescens TaxID=2067669 RepID=UPI003564F6BE
MYILAIARLELLIARRNLWVAIAILLMVLFDAVLTMAGDAPTGMLGVSPLTVALTSITTLSVYLVPLIGLLLSFDAISGEMERGTLTLSLSYPLSRVEILIGKFLAHICVLAIAIGIGLGLTATLVIVQHGSQHLEILPLVRLFLTSLALGASFLGLGYAVSILVRQTGAASGIAIAIWLVCVVLYDLGLLGALVANGSGVFAKSVFPWMLVANPADAFRLINTPDITANILGSGVSAAGSVVGFTGQLLSLTLWPLIALALSCLVFEKAEP